MWFVISRFLVIRGARIMCQNSLCEILLECHWGNVIWNLMRIHFIHRIQAPVNGCPVWIRPISCASGNWTFTVIVRTWSLRVESWWWVLYWLSFTIWLEAWACLMFTRTKDVSLFFVIGYLKWDHMDCYAKTDCFTFTGRWMHARPTGADISLHAGEALYDYVDYLWTWT